MWWHYTPAYWFLWFFGATDEPSWRYGFWSGVGISACIPLTNWWHHRCHEPRCQRIGHPHEGYVYCKKHLHRHDERRAAKDDLTGRQADR